jgi:hypothetical protein
MCLGDETVKTTIEKKTAIQAEAATKEEKTPRMDLRVKSELLESAHRTLVGAIGRRATGRQMSNGRLFQVAALYLLSREWDEQLRIAEHYGKILEKLEAGDTVGMVDARGGLRVEPHESGGVQSPGFVAGIGIDHGSAKKRGGKKD